MIKLAWPGLALALTFVDDLVAGPVLAVAGALLGGWQGIALGACVFTILVGALVASVIATSRTIDPAVQARIDAAVLASSRRRVVGRFLATVGDEHPWSTALVAALISPVLAVLLARIVHPTQRLVRTAVVASLAYGLAFAVFYSGLGAGGSMLVS